MPFSVKLPNMLVRFPDFSVCLGNKTSKVLEKRLLDMNGPWQCLFYVRQYDHFLTPLEGVGLPHRPPAVSTCAAHSHASSVFLPPKTEAKFRPDAWRHAIIEQTEQARDVSVFEDAAARHQVCMHTFVFELTSAVRSITRSTCLRECACAYRIKETFKKLHSRRIGHLHTVLVKNHDLCRPRNPSVCRKAMSKLLRDRPKRRRCAS